MCQSPFPARSFKRRSSNVRMQPREVGEGRRRRNQANSGNHRHAACCGIKVRDPTLAASHITFGSAKEQLQHRDCR